MASQPVLGEVSAEKPAQLGGSDLPQKGIARSGEAYCLECGTAVDESAERCQSCGAVLDEVVKAFSCPRCQSLLALGTSECTSCGMKFKVKALKHRGEDSETDAKESEEDSSEGGEEALRSLLEAANELIPEKSAILSRMVNRRAAEKKRLSKIDASSPKPDLVESEVVSLAEDFDDIARLHAELLSISELVRAAAEVISLSEETKAKALAMKAVAGAGEADTGGRGEIAEKEEQLAKREEMVDRKIKGYASKKKELQDQEAVLAEKLKELEGKNAELQRMREEAEGAGTKEWEQREREVARRLTILQTVMSGVLGMKDSREDGSMDENLSDLEASIKSLLDKSSASEKKLNEMRECEGEMKQLLAVLDKLLGKLPEEAIQEFTSSETYKLYEKVLDRYGI